MSDPSYANSPQNAVPGPLNGQQYRFAPTYIRNRDPTTSDLKPKENQGYYPIGSFWVNSEGPSIFVLLSIDSVNFVTEADWVPIDRGDSQPIIEIIGGTGTTGFPVNPNTDGQLQFTSNDSSVTITGSAGSINFAVDESHIDTVEQFTVPSGTTTVLPAASTGNVNFTSSDSSVTITGSTNTVDLKANQTVIHAVRQITPISGTSPVVPTDPAGNISITSGDSSINAVGGLNTLALSVNSTAVSFTPTLSFGGGSTGITYGTQVGVYLQLGKLVYIYGQIILTNKGSSTGKVRINGAVPFPTTGAVASNIAVNMDLGITLDVNFTSVFGYMPSGSAQIQIYEQGSGQTSFYLDETYFSNTSSFEFCGMYISA